MAAHGRRGLLWLAAAATLTVVLATPSHSTQGDDARDREELLRRVSSLTGGFQGETCITPPHYSLVPVAVRTERYRGIQHQVDLLSRLLPNLTYPETVVEAAVKSLVDTNAGVRAARVFLSQGQRLYNLTRPSPAVLQSSLNAAELQKLAWALSSSSWSDPRWQEGDATGRWTFPYFDCWSRRWLLSYTAPLARSPQPSDLRQISVDVDVTDLDIDQCDPTTDGDPEADLNQQFGEGDDHDQVIFFRGTHKCHNESSRCEPVSGLGWQRGGYECRCRQGYYARNTTFDGALVEVAWEGLLRGEPTYELLYECHACPRDCPNCTDNRTCNADFHWPFRVALLTISLACVVLTFVVMAAMYHYRAVKVFRLASPTFLTICLLGCAIMYLEMAAIFPVLDTYSCVATKWTRHLGFCVTFAALLMKTWRVSLTYRVTSAHKIKLTDKQLLQWLTPILLIVLVYLGAWSLSATPSTEIITDYSDLKFYQCRYDWWDHSMAAGEVLFLMWGVKVCFSVRKAESFFDEAKYISWAVYNIAMVNIVMVTFHLIIFPKAGPDIKYLFGFLRTQFSTSTTILLIFGPKFYRIAQGTGDQYDNRARAKGVTASFSLNGLGVMNDEPADLSQENEELKEEIQKLAAQMEFMKIVHMEVNNRHLKPRPGGYFTDKSSILSTAQSPGTKTPATTPGSKAPAATSISARASAVTIPGAKVPAATLQGSKAASTTPNRAEDDGCNDNTSAKPSPTTDLEQV